MTECGASNQRQTYPAYNRKSRRWGDWIHVCCSGLVGAGIGQHPDCDGRAGIMVAQGRLTERGLRHENRLPERTLELETREFIHPIEGISHHIHNRGDQVDRTIYVFER